MFSSNTEKAQIEIDIAETSPDENPLADPAIIIVGGGPIALFTAIQLAYYLQDQGKSLKDFPILILEKHKQYQRKHILFIDHQSFTGTHPNPEFQAFVNNIPSSIRTNDLEADLLKYAIKLSVKIEYTEVTDCEKLMAQYPSAKAFVGADGSHSVVRKQMFNDEYQTKEDLRHIIEVKYEVQGKTRALHRTTEVFPVLGYTKKYLISEFVGKMKADKTPVSLRIFVDKETYEYMQDATFKNPYKFSMQDKIEKDLFDNIDTWFKARKYIANENRIEGSELITATNLPVYACKEFIKKVNGKYVVLVGDAACGVPFYRSLNNGIICSSKLAKVLHAICMEIPLTKKSNYFFSKKITPEEYFQSFMKKRVNSEIFYAKLKDSVVNSFESTANAARSYPGSHTNLLLTEGGREFVKAMNGNKSLIPDYLHTSSSSFYSKQEAIDQFAREFNGESNKNEVVEESGCLMM